jgi:hypothetical protein
MAQLAFLAWLLAPWAIFASKVVRISRYDAKVGLGAGLGRMQIRELFQRRSERMATDPYYKQLHAEAKRWIIITTIWWPVSLIGATIINLSRGR